MQRRLSRLMLLAMLTAAGTAVLTAMPAAQAQNAVELAGVRYPVTVQLGATPLTLNGAGSPTFRRHCKGTVANEVRIRPSFPTFQLFKHPTYQPLNFPAPKPPNPFESG